MKTINIFTFWCITMFMWLVTVSGLPCQQRKVTYGLVCVCNETYCDTLENITSNGSDLVLVSSSKGGLRYHVDRLTLTKNKETVHLTDKVLNNDDNQNETPKPLFQDASSGRQIVETTIVVNRQKKYQTIIGFGGAFTGSVSHILENIPESLQHHIYRSYYSSTDGIGYNFMRIPIGGSDFDLAPWAYNELPINDHNLSNFTVLDKRDLKRLNQIKELESLTDNNNIKYLGATWSPPPWMKTNNDWTGRSALKPELYSTWANYHLRYLELMSAKNLNFWGISTGNEPLNGVIAWLFVRFMSLGWTPGNQGKWVGDHLGPQLQESKFNNVKILGADDQRYVFPWWFQRMDRVRPNSTNYLDGFAVHWYWDQLVSPTLLDLTNQKYPNKFILNTESCVGDKPLEFHGPKLGSWSRAQKYAQSYIQALQHWVSGWIDWNLILDEKGGPNYVKNYVDAPVIVNFTSRTEFYKQPMFYVIGHFSRFIVADSIRIDAISSHADILSVGFERPDKSIAVVLYNKSNGRANIKFVDEQSGSITIDIPAKSIHTLVYY